jgi:VIT1/CCC1 family predicted Fe2+/Mn2+ transporter
MAQVTVEREELAMVPDEEEEELALIYESKGLSLEQARATARSIIGGDVGPSGDRGQLTLDPCPGRPRSGHDPRGQP